MDKVEIVPQCTKLDCPHYKTCCKVTTEYYIKDGNRPTVAFVGQGAGKVEEKLHRSFVGPAGKRLREICKKAWDDGHIFNPVFTNTVRCHPKDGNGKDRVPTDTEVRFCEEYMWNDIEEIEPDVIIPVGMSAASVVAELPEYSSMAKIHGKTHDPKNGSTKVIPTYHPSYVIRVHGRGTFSLDNKWDKVVYDDIVEAIS